MANAWKEAVAPPWLKWASLVGGASYPAWTLLAPEGARDPLWAWFAVAAFYAVCSGAAIVRRRQLELAWLVAPQLASTLHLHVLFGLNPHQPFYACAGLLQVFTSLLVLQDLAPFFTYACFALAASSLPFVLGGGLPVVFYSGGVASLVYFVSRSARDARSERQRAGAHLDATRAELAQEKAERRRLEEELQLAQRMDSLGRLAGAFAHEFNNQLMAIRIHAELLEQALPTESGLQKDLERIQATTSSAADLTARLLAFSRSPRSPGDRADLCRVVRESLVTLRHVMSEKTPVASVLADGACFVPVDAKQIDQVLLNLALNARDAMRDGGTLRIDVSRCGRSEVELPIEMPSERLVVLSVADSGSGIEESVRSKIFEPFFTTKAGQGNTGLGLSVVYGIVKESGGHIRVESEGGHGTRFQIFWPELASQAESRAAPESPAAAPPSRARVLLVEDQAALREGLARWLERRGFAVVACADAAAALAHAAEVDVLASDVVMTGMDGIELVGKLRERAPALPAVLFSGQLDHLATAKRQLPDGVPLLEKPFDPELLIAALDAQLGLRRTPGGAHQATP